MAKRFRAVVQAQRAAPSDVMLSWVLFDINAFASSAPQHDDVTLMLVKALQRGGGFGLISDTRSLIRLTN